MKQITRNLMTYAAEIHAAVEELEDRLPHFVPLGEHQRQSSGFVNVIPDQDARVLKVPGGWAICLREDTKGVPAEEVTKAANEKVAAIKEALGRKVGKAELRQIKADVIHDLLPRAFARQKKTYVMYSERTQRLFVNTGSQKAADLVMTHLVECLKSLKTSTVHVSEPKMGLTTRLHNWLADRDEEYCFGTMTPASEVVMKGNDRKWSIKAESLGSVADTLREAINGHATVDSIGFAMDNGVTFRITAALRVQGVKHRVVEDDQDTEISHCWVSQLASELATLDDILDVMLDLLSPEKAQATADTAAEDDDPLAGLF